MKILVCGGRDFSNRDLVDDNLALFINEDYLSLPMIIQGGANGADYEAKEWAERWNLECVEFPAEWDKNGKAAGFIRNQQMINEKPDYVVAFWDGKSKGTQDTINRAKKAKIPTLIVYY